MLYTNENGTIEIQNKIKQHRQNKTKKYNLNCEHANTKNWPTKISFIHGQWYTQNKTSKKQNETIF